MKNTKENKEKIIQYLYGGLSETVRNEFEDLLFSDEDFSLFVEDVENDLIDEYIRGELEFDEKRRFETKYLNSESRQNRVDSARTLHAEVFNKENTSVVSQGESSGIWTAISNLFGVSNPVLAGSVAVLLLMTLFGGYWFITQQGARPDIAESNNTNETPAPKEPSVNETQTNKDDLPEVNKNSADIKPSPSPKTKTNNNTKTKRTPRKLEKDPKIKKEPKVVPKQSTIFAFSLMPPLRSSSTPVLRIPLIAKTVRLRLFDNFGSKYEQFRIELNGATGKTVWSRQIRASKKRPQKSIAISIPTRHLNQRNYEVAVYGITKDGSVEDVNFYNFVVQHRK